MHSSWSLGPREAVMFSSFIALFFLSVGFGLIGGSCLSLLRTSLWIVVNISKLSSPELATVQVTVDGIFIFCLAQCYKGKQGQWAGQLLSLLTDIVAGLEVFRIAILRQGELYACTVAALENTAVNSDHTSVLKPTV